VVWVSDTVSAESIGQFGFGFGIEPKKIGFGRILQYRTIDKSRTG
jgi:hypothetical protein